MIRIDAEKALFLLDQCVKQRGKNFVYEKQDDANCLYVHDATAEVWDPAAEDYDTIDTPESATPGCMIGLALAKAGVPLSAFTDLGVNSEDAYVVSDRLKFEGIAEISWDAERIFRVAQERQDRGSTWGEALACARQA
jgi:hypothetical protein